MVPDYAKNIPVQKSQNSLFCTDMIVPSDVYRENYDEMEWDTDSEKEETIKVVT